MLFRSSDASARSVPRLPQNGFDWGGIAGTAIDQYTEQRPLGCGESPLTQRPILLVGAGGHARACLDVIEQQGRFAVAGLIGLSHEVGAQLLGYGVLGTDEILPALFGRCSTAALVAIGQIKTPEPRERIFGLLDKRGFELPVIVSPVAYVSKHATLGAGTIVM